MKPIDLDNLFRPEDFKIPKGFTENTTMAAQLANARFHKIIKEHGIKVFHWEGPQDDPAWYVEGDGYVGKHTHEGVLFMTKEPTSDARSPAPQQHRS